MIRKNKKAYAPIMWAIVYKELIVILLLAGIGMLISNWTNRAWFGWTFFTVGFLFAHKWRIV